MVRLLPLPRGDRAALSLGACFCGDHAATQQFRILTLRHGCHIGVGYAKKRAWEDFVKETTMLMFLTPLRLIRARAAAVRRPVHTPAQALTALDQMYAYFDRS